MDGMLRDGILIVAGERAAGPVAEELRRALDRGVDVAETRRAALLCLRRQEYAVVLLEEGLAAGDAAGTDLLYAAAGAAAVLELSFAVQGTLRMVRQVKAALQRRTQDQARARKVVARNLQGELNASLTGILLQSQLALRAATPAQVPKLQQLVEMAGDLRRRLGAG